ncbi:hypothetical protein IAT38_003798 [Cryptococcus sp. DSM 104549]
MQAHRGGAAPTPPPLPRMPRRTPSASTISTVQTSYTSHSGTALQNSLMPPPSPLGGPRSPGSASMALRSLSGASGISGASAPAGALAGDELDKLGYIYSLRVALLHHHLLHPQPAANNRMSNASSFSHASISTPPIPPLPSPPLTGTSPGGSRLTFSAFGGRSPGPKTPELPPPSPPPQQIRRKSSAWTLGGKKDKSEDSGVKLPKEFLLEFWGILGAEEGDQGWKTAVAAFLGMVKKGTKTPSGLNLREVPTLLEAFTQVIPSPGPGCAPAHMHQSHLLQLLYNTLPRSSHFSPLARPQSEKDRDHLFRLRAEVQSYMLAPSPNPAVDVHSASSNGLASPAPVATAPRKSPVGIGRASPHSQDSVKRKPSPIWDGDVNEMVDTVGQVWGVRRDMVDRDVMEVKGSSRTIEQTYMSDLKRAMTVLSAQPPPLTPSQKSRQAYLSQALSNLLRDFPELAAPGSPNEYANGPLSPGGLEISGSAFFTPPRFIEVFGRLAARAAESGHSTRTRDLVERCREVWGISSRREKEKELEGLIGRWGDSIGTKDEVPLARVIADGIRLVAVGMRPGDPLPPVMDELLGNLLMLATTSLPTIFPTTSGPPPAPPPSLLLIFNAAPELFSADKQAKVSLDNASDELKGAAIGEYVGAVEHLTGGVGMGGMGGDDGYRRTGESGKDSVVEGLEKVAMWMEKEVTGVKKVYGRGLGSILNPASVILSRQLPLFLAELQILDKPRGAASDIFTLYETTGKLLDLWDELCPDQEHGFELDAFFEPHVMGWLKDTEVNNVHDWVSRSVGMDSWVPEGENRHSQSVIDLFEFVRGSAQVILHELPLSEYKRALYLIDYSKTVSVAVNQYAATVLALFMADMNPVKASTPTMELQKKVGGKAGSWLAKGQQAVKNLERKKVDGFSIPPSACVKLTDMGAAQTSLEDMSFAMEAEDCARIVKAHKLGAGAAPERGVRHVFTVTVLRGEGLLGRGLHKPADGFVTVVDKETGERCVKTKTILGVEDPKWEQSFEVSVSSIKILELQVYDRQLVGKHDCIGLATFKLDPRAFADLAIRDIVLPLNPRGVVHIRISMEGGEKHDVQYHLSAAGRSLGRAEADMVREIVDKMGEFIRAQLSMATLAALTKPLKDRKRVKTVLTEQDVEGSLAPLFDYLNETFSVFSVTLTYETRIRVMLAIWHRIIDTLICLLVPPLSPTPSSAPPLPAQEVDVVFKWLQMLKAFFNASENGVEHGVALAQLQAGPYKDIIMLGQYLDLPTPTLKERCSAAVRAASGKNTRDAGVNGGLSSGMRGMRLDDVKEDDSERMAEVMLRIARTRGEMAEFLAHEIGLLTKSRVERQTGVL